MVAQRLMRIREVTAKDMQAVLNIEYKCFPDPYPLSLLQRLHAMHSYGFLVAEMDGKIVGYVIGVIRWGGTGHILSIGVDPPYQRQRIGSALMEHAMDHLRAKGAKFMRLEVRVSNLGAQHFYRKLGFREREHIPYYYEDGETAVAMELPFEE